MHLKNSDITADLKKAKVSRPLQTKNVRIDTHCLGERWSAQDQTKLAKLIAIIAMGQADYAASILKNLKNREPGAPAATNSDIVREAKIKLTVQKDGEQRRTGYPREQRDGFIFGAISWIAAIQHYSPCALLKEPPINPTVQGIDGLMIELTNDKSQVKMTTVFEDKCTAYPRKTFRKKVIPAFLRLHRNERCPELVASASALLRMAGINITTASQLAAAVTNLKLRRYRCAFALIENFDSHKERQKLFKGYNALDGMQRHQRVGASFIVCGELRKWFDAIAKEAIAHLDKIAKGKT